MNTVRYRHTGALGSSNEDSFSFHLWDGSNRSPEVVFPVAIKDVEKGNFILDLHAVYTVLTKGMSTLDIEGGSWCSTSGCSPDRGKN